PPSRAPTPPRRRPPPRCPGAPASPPDPARSPVRSADYRRSPIAPAGRKPPPASATLAPVRPLRHPPIAPGISRRPGHEPCRATIRRHSLRRLPAARPRCSRLLDPREPVVSDEGSGRAAAPGRCGGADLAPDGAHLVEGQLAQLLAGPAVDAQVAGDLLRPGVA